VSIFSGFFLFPVSAVSPAVLRRRIGRRREKMCGSNGLKTAEGHHRMERKRLKTVKELHTEPVSAVYGGIILEACAF